MKLVLFRSMTQIRQTLLLLPNSVCFFCCDIFTARTGHGCIRFFALVRPTPVFTRVLRTKICVIKPTQFSARMTAFSSSISRPGFAQDVALIAHSVVERGHL